MGSVLKWILDRIYGTENTSSQESEVHEIPAGGHLEERLVYPIHNGEEQQRVTYVLKSSEAGTIINTLIFTPGCTDPDATAYELHVTADYREIVDGTTVSPANTSFATKAVCITRN